ncbi:MAG: TIGR01777 family oxidoreductase [Thermodesulfobacteriota bacterium]
MMQILISGASGLIGKEIANSLAEQGHQIVSLQRKSAATTPYWDIENEIIELGANQKIDVVINLAGESIADGRWNQQKKAKIKNSRVKGTKLLAEYFSRANYQPKVFISASAIGFYGDRGDEKLSEESRKGTGFLSDVCYQWEGATTKAAQSGIRVANIRSGIVLSLKGGALKKMLPPFKMGLGGIIGTGKQYISWVTINDVVGIINHIIKNEALKGPINLVSPNPVTNHDFTKTLGKLLNRPTCFPLPAAMAKILLGEMAQELLLASTKVIPGKLQESGYIFKYATLQDAFKAILKR